MQGGWLTNWLSSLSLTGVGPRHVRSRCCSPHSAATPCSPVAATPRQGGRTRSDHSQESYLVGSMLGCSPFCWPSASAWRSIAMKNAAISSSQEANAIGTAYLRSQLARRAASFAPQQAAHRLHRQPHRARFRDTRGSDRRSGDQRQAADRHLGRSHGRPRLRQRPWHLDRHLDHLQRSHRPRHRAESRVGRFEFPRPSCCSFTASWS